MFNLVAPSITGNPNQAGNALTVSDGEWETGINGVVTHAYQWLSDGVPIADATDPKYTLRADDIGQAISCAWWSQPMPQEAGRWPRAMSSSLAADQMKRENSAVKNEAKSNPFARAASWDLRSLGCSGPRTYLQHAKP